MKSITLILSFVILSLMACNTHKEEGANNQPATEQVASPSEDVSEEKEEVFNRIDVTQLNEKIAGKTEMTAKEVMELYYPAKAGTEGKEQIGILEKTLENGHIELKLIHDYMLDDAIKAKKYVMELKQAPEGWEVISLQNNWKCWPERGHTDWGTAPCE